jgi:hypothetical protein
MWPRVRKELGFFLASFAAFSVAVLLDVFYVITMGQFYFLTGIPTPGGAPFLIHVINMGLKGAYAATAYAIVMRLWFGKISISRVAVLWVFGLFVIALLGSAAITGGLSVNAAVSLGLVTFFVSSLLVARDWVSR